MSYRFKRFVNGVEMAEGILIEDARDLSHAIDKATKIAARTYGNVVLVLDDDNTSKTEQQLVEDCDPDTKLAVIAHALRQVAEHARDGGSYRFLVYERLGLGPEAYGALLEDGMFISNELDYAQMQEVRRVVKDKKIDELKSVLWLCDEPGCFENVSHGWIDSKDEYRRTCRSHYTEKSSLLSVTGVL